MHHIRRRFSLLLLALSFLNISFALPLPLQQDSRSIQERGEPELPTPVQLLMFLKTGHQHHDFPPLDPSKVVVDTEYNGDSADQATTENPKLISAETVSRLPGFYAEFGWHVYQLHDQLVTAMIHFSTKLTVVTPEKSDPKQNRFWMKTGSRLAVNQQNAGQIDTIKILVAKNKGFRINNIRESNGKVSYPDAKTEKFLLGQLELSEPEWRPATGPGHVRWGALPQPDRAAKPNNTPHAPKNVGAGAPEPHTGPRTGSRPPTPGRVEITKHNIGSFTPHVA